MGMNIKSSLFGGVLAIAISGGIFFTVPGSIELEDKKLLAEETDYSRSLYGVPVLEMSHYKVGEDKHLNYMIKGNYSVGRDNPSGETLWFKSVKDNPELLTALDALKGKISNAKSAGSTLQDTLGETAKAAKKAKEEEERLKAEAEEEAKRLEEEKELAETETEADIDNEDINIDEKNDKESSVDAVDIKEIKSEGINILKELNDNYSSDLTGDELKDFSEKANKSVNDYITKINNSKESIADKDLEILQEVSKSLESLLNNYNKEKGKDSKSISSKIENSLNSLGK